MTLRLRPFAMCVLAASWVAGCATAPFDLEAVADRDAVQYPDAKRVVTVTARAETTPVATNDDAADDPAIWINRADPAASLILGTDKKSGIGVYTLAGELRQFLPLGLPNNVDLRQGVDVGDWSGDLAIASNRAGDVISLLSVDAAGVRHLGDFPSVLAEPYGACVGVIDSAVIVFVTYKNGTVVAHELLAVRGGIEQSLVGQLAFSGQLEGCVVDDEARTVYIGEEERALWRSELSRVDGRLFFGHATALDTVGSETGIVADIEGVALYRTPTTRYVIASSQGNDSYAVYDVGATGPAFVGRFRITAGDVIDGAQETDGVAVSSHQMGSTFPQGILVAQDGFNAPAGTTQNFKIVDWRDVANSLGL